MTRQQWIGLFLAGLILASLTIVGSAQNDSNPYGFSVWGYQSRAAASGVKWIRDQRDWKSIETSPGVYDWSGLDSDVSAANAAGVHVDFPIQDAPGWDLAIACDPSLPSLPILPGASQVSTFAGLVAQRYNGQNGHGYIDSFEIGNEEWDNYWNGSWSNSTPCRQASLYGPVLQAGYRAIKGQSPTSLVGMTGLWWLDMTHFHDYLTWLYQNGYGADMDYANFHYYVCSADPTTANPTYASAWQTLRGVQSAFNDGAKPIWTTEVGWTVSGVSQDSSCIVSTSQQSQYIQAVLDSARTSGAVQRVFLYTISDTGSDGMNLYPSTGPLPSYTMLETYIGQYPSWAAASATASAAATPTPAPTPTPTATPSPTPTPTASPLASPTPAPTPLAGPALVLNPTESVRFSGKWCRKGTVKASGTFVGNGLAGTVTYEWIRQDSRGTVTVSEPAITLLAGDTTVHSVNSDSWSAASAGSDQLVFLGAGEPALTPIAFSCG
jgi:hypothetical protein